MTEDRSVPEHFVQLCDSRESLSAAAAKFMIARHAAGDWLLIVARESNWIAIHRILAARGVDLAAATTGGRIVVLNAVTMLAKLTRNGQPHGPSFETVVAEPVRALAAKGRLSIYGEMVDLLAESDDVHAALALEGLWNDLAGRESFRLMCGYSAAHFVARRAEARLRDVCAAHTHVRCDDGDPLGGWLLKRSELDFASSPPPGGLLN
jgi:hypothetical protein